jgi:hypothetical protein
VALALANEENGSEALREARLSDTRVVLGTLQRLSRDGSPTQLEEAAQLAVEWFVGSRLLKRHREVLGNIQFRLDTVESKTAAFRDLVFCSVRIGALKGLVLLLDELEKQDYAQSKVTLLRFLSAIRALIDALPRYLFLMAAMTPNARDRYFGMLPAFAGRLQNQVEVRNLNDSADALKLYRFYLENAEQEAKQKAESEKRKPSPSVSPVVTKSEAIGLFDRLMADGRTRGYEGVRQRDLLNELHKKAEERIQGLASPA